MSTTEVSEALGLLDFIQEANVYGVSIPGGWCTLRHTVWQNNSLAAECGFESNNGTGWQRPPQVKV